MNNANFLDDKKLCDDCIRRIDNIEKLEKIKKDIHESFLNLGESLKELEVEQNRLFRKYKYSNDVVGVKLRNVNKKISNRSIQKT